MDAILDLIALVLIGVPMDLAVRAVERGEAQPILAAWRDAAATTRN